ncbi:hypothetical protein SLEP1_g54981 [Rubroshorea leprosula]|uniref:Uncharacterized protein n=1 Tax=Rubroshorea leprosula TaxID=152421 RepID=A0AAV5MF50_9ROSI|nr:hypothetical protein SLEP1_g54981 [Rubroshorea leprosula]
MLCSSPPAAPACGGANCLGFGFGPCWEIWFPIVLSISIEIECSVLCE